MDKLWRWLFKYSRKRIKRSHIEKHHNDIKCPNCKEWFSISGIEYKHSTISQPDFGFHVKCGKCEHESYWNAVAAPVMLLCDKNGSPL